MNEKIKRRIGFFAILLGSFLAQLDTTIVNIAAPKIGQYMNSPISTTSWIASIYALALGVLLLTASKLADQFGRKKFFIIGLIIFTLSSILCSVAKTIDMLIIFRAIQGIGAAIITPVVIPMAVVLLGKEKNALISAAFGATSAFAASFGGPVGGFIVEYFSWRWIFIINVPICVITLLLILFTIQESYDDSTSKQIDYLGIFLLTAGLFLFVLSLIKSTDYGITSPKLLLMLIGSFVFLALFFFVETRVTAPMLDFNLFKERNFRNSTICMMFVGIGLSPAIFLLNFFMNDIQGISNLKIGFTLCTLSIASMGFSIITPIFYRKLGHRLFNIISMVAFIFGNYLLSNLTPDIPQYKIVLFLIVLGIAMGCGAPALIGGAMLYIDEKKTGIASGIINMSRQIGILLGLAIFVSVLNNQLVTNFVSGKKEFINHIQNSTVLDNKVKASMIVQVANLTSKSKQQDKKEILNKMDEEKVSVLKTVPLESRPKVEEKFEAEKAELSRLMDEGIIMLKNESTRAFNFTFICSCLVLILSLFFAFKTKPKQIANNENAKKRDLVNLYD